MLSKWQKSLFSTLINKITLNDFLHLTKFKLSLLNGIVTVGAYSLYPTSFSCLPLLASSIAVSMSTQALNQYIQIEYDKKMQRTSQRPLVKGVNPKIALGIGAGFGFLGFTGLFLYNPMTAAIGASIWLGYLLIYTRMKATSELNTFIGSIIGSLPVYLGWAASGRSICMVQPFALAIYMMAWQHQHFYGIRWIYFDDYNNAGFKMERSKMNASAQIVIQTVLSIVLVNYSLHYFGVMSCYIFGIPLSLGIYHWGIKSSLAFSRGQITGKQLKMQSYKHFTLVFVILVLCSLLNRYSSAEKLDKKSFKQRNQVKHSWEESLNTYL